MVYRFKPKLRRAKLKKVFCCVVLALMLCGCGVNWGPGPEKGNYMEAIEPLGQGFEADYILRGFWYPNVFLESSASFLAGHVEGCRLFLTKEKFVVTQYDEKNNLYVPAIEIPYADITSASKKFFMNGWALRLSGRSTGINSFRFCYGSDGTGKNIDKDKLIEICIGYALKK